MYRFALRPLWIVSHVLVLALIVLMVNLGLWQLRRLDEKQARNAVVAARTAEPVVDVGELLAPDDGFAAAEDLAYRTVTATGEWAAEEQVIVRGRSLDGAPGSWILTPLRRADGSLVVVNRGWFRNDGTFDAVPARFVPPVGTVEVTGLLLPTQTRGRFGGTDPPGGDLTSLARVDLERYAAQLDGPVVPAWVQLTDQVPDPPPAAAPTVLAPPEMDEGPHFAYAVQWFIFSSIAIIGYPMILRRTARDRARGGTAEPAPESRHAVEPES